MDTKETTENVNEEVENTASPETAADQVNETAENATEAEAEKELTPEEKMALQVADLQKKVEELTAANNELKTQALYKAAEFENFRKRMQQEKQDALDYGTSNLLKDLLDSLDNFDRTVEAAATATDPKTIADGVTMINKSMVSMLENKYNLVSYGAPGEAFDPDIHEAIGMQEGDVAEEQLAAVYLKGYKLKNRVIRHAKVMVMKPKA